MGDVQGAYVKNCANFQKGARFKIRLENEARTRVRFISPRRRGKTAYRKRRLIPFDFSLRNCLQLTASILGALIIL